MGSESRAASMGGLECVSFEVASAASSVATAHALEEIEAEEYDMVKQQFDAVPVVAASVVADIAERMILGEDIALDMAFIHHSPELSMQLLSGNENPEKQKEETM